MHCETIGYNWHGRGLESRRRIATHSSSFLPRPPGKGPDDELQESPHRNRFTTCEVAKLPEWDKRRCRTKRLHPPSSGSSNHFFTLSLFGPVSARAYPREFIVSVSEITNNASRESFGSLHMMWFPVQPIVHTQQGHQPASRQQSSFHIAGWRSPLAFPPSHACQLVPHEWRIPHALSWEAPMWTNSIRSSLAIVSKFS